MDTITLPSKSDGRTSFQAHGRAFFLRRLDGHLPEWSLVDSEERGHCRFGTADEIRQDIMHVLTWGKLPCAKVRGW